MKTCWLINEQLFEEPCETLNLWLKSKRNLKFLHSCPISSFPGLCAYNNSLLFLLHHQNLPFNSAIPTKFIHVLATALFSCSLSWQNLLEVSPVLACTSSPHSLKSTPMSLVSPSFCWNYSCQEHKWSHMARWDSCSGGLHCPWSHTFLVLFYVIRCNFSVFFATT